MYLLQMRNHIKYDLRDLYVHCACALCIVQCAYNYTVEGGGVLYWVGSVQIDEIDQLGWAGCTEHCTVGRGAWCCGDTSEYDWLLIRDVTAVHSKTKK